MADKMKAIFPPFPIAGFVPNFTGYDLNQEAIDWYDIYEKTLSYDEPLFVSTFLNYYC